MSGWGQQGKLCLELSALCLGFSPKGSGIPKELEIREIVVLARVWNRLELKTRLVHCNLPSWALWLSYVFINDLPVGTWGSDIFYPPEENCLYFIWFIFTLKWLADTEHGIDQEHGRNIVGSKMPIERLVDEKKNKSPLILGVKLLGSEQENFVCMPQVV